MQLKLIGLRRGAMITQEEMANALGISTRTYSNKERGVSEFKTNEIFAIAKILDKPIEEIFLPYDFKNLEDKKELTR